MLMVFLRYVAILESRNMLLKTREKIDCTVPIKIH